MLDMHEDKGSEDWEIYAECVREAMAKTGNYTISNQPIREKREYENFLYGLSDDITINDRVIYNHKISSSRKKTDPQEGHLQDPNVKDITEPLINN